MLTHSSPLQCPHCGLGSRVGEIGEHLRELHTGAIAIDWLCGDQCTFRTPSEKVIAAHCLLTGHSATLIQRQRNDLTFASFLAKVKAQLPQPNQEIAAYEDIQEGFASDEISERHDSDKYMAWSEEEDPVSGLQSASGEQRNKCISTLKFAPSRKRGSRKAKDNNALNAWSNTDNSEADVFELSSDESPPELNCTTTRSRITESLKPTNNINPRQKRDQQKSTVHSQEPKKQDNGMDPKYDSANPYCNICKRAISSTSSVNLLDHLQSINHRSHLVTDPEKQRISIWVCKCGLDFVSSYNVRRHVNGSQNSCRMSDIRIRAVKEEVIKELQSAFPNFSKIRLHNGVQKIFTRH